MSYAEYPSTVLVRPQAPFGALYTLIVIVLLMTEDES